MMLSVTGPFCLFLLLPLIKLLSEGYTPVLTELQTIVIPQKMPISEGVCVVNLNNFLIKRPLTFPLERIYICFLKVQGQ